MKYAFWECFPISWYGEKLRDRLLSLATSGKVWMASAMNMLTFFVLILTVSIVTGLYLGGVAWLKEFLIGFKAARAIELKAIKGQEGRPFTPQVIAEIAALETADGHRPVGAFGWNGVQLWFYGANGDKFKTIDNGRTVEPGDLMLDSVEFLYSNAVDGQLFTTAGASKLARPPQQPEPPLGIGEVLTSAQHLRTLGYTNATVTHLAVAYEGQRSRVRVAGVYDGLGLPDFMITEDFRRATSDRNWVPNPLHDRFFLGPFAAGGAQAVLSSPAVAAYLKRDSTFVTAETITRRGAEWLELKLMAGEPPAGEGWWMTYPLQAIRDHADPSIDQSAWRAEPGRIIRGTSTDERNRTALLGKQFMRASVYVNDIEDIEPIAAALEQANYGISNDVREWATFFLQFQRAGKWLIGAVMMVVGLLGIVTVTLSVLESIGRKIPEIGMLKAFGADDSVVLRIYLSRTLLIWFGAMMAVTLCVHLGHEFVNEWIGAALVKMTVLSIPPEMVQTPIFHLPWFQQMMIAAGSLAVCLLATGAASLWAGRMEPAKALQLR